MHTPKHTNFFNYRPTHPHTHTHKHISATYSHPRAQKKIHLDIQASEWTNTSEHIHSLLALYLFDTLTHTHSQTDTRSPARTHTHAHTHLNALTRTTQENTNTWRDDWILHGWFATKKKEEEGSDACFNKNGNYDSISNQLISRSGLLRKYGLSKPAPPGAVYRNERREGSGL